MRNSNKSRGSNSRLNGFQTPSNSSPTNGKRGCLCWDSNTYSSDCCDGTLRAQGIGRIRKI